MEDREVEDKVEDELEDENGKDLGMLHAGWDRYKAAHKNYVELLPDDDAVVSFVTFRKLNVLFMVKDGEAGHARHATVTIKEPCAGLPPEVEQQGGADGAAGNLATVTFCGPYGGEPRIELAPRWSSRAASWTT